MEQLITKALKKNSIPQTGVALGLLEHHPTTQPIVFVVLVLAPMSQMFDSELILWMTSVPIQVVGQT